MKRRSPVQCPVWVDHRSVDLARQRISGLGLADLYDWTTNVAYDVAALVDRARGGEPDVEMLGTAEAMLHACIVEISQRKVRSVPVR